MAIDLSETLITRKEAASILGCGLSTADKMARRGELTGIGHLVFRLAVENLKFRRYDKTRSPWHRDFFKHYEPETAYWAGFIMADGCIHEGHYGSPSLSLHLSSKDTLHLEELALS